MVKVRVGISTKLILMVTAIVVGAIGIVVWIATDLFREDSITRVQESNKDYADVLAVQSFNIFKSGVEKMTLIGDAAIKNEKVFKDPALMTQVKNLLRQSDDFFSFGIYELTDAGIHEEFFVARDEVLPELKLSEEALRTVLEKDPSKLKKLALNELTILNLNPQFLTLALVNTDDSQKKTFLMRADMRPDNLIKTFQKKELISAFLVSKDGTVLLHSDASEIKRAAELASLPIVQKIREGKLNNHQMEFMSAQGESYLGAFKTVGISGLSVVAQTKKADALATLNRVHKRALLVTAIVVGLAFLLNFGFSISMTSPLGALVDATEKISKGIFDVKLASKSNDEIGVLTQAFQKMTSGLQERDKLKSTFNKFHSQEIANKILSGAIKLGGERKTATIFFSDIRNFTAMSEELSPDQVVTMLNEYMTEMVKIIYKHKGVVDKYIGDAIMALWGVPNGSPDDARHAVLAALEMREKLAELNKRRERRNLPAIQIGMGIHTGSVLAGNIGSEQRLEYTVIGDSVNQASRIESATKDVKTDLLISGQTLSLVKKVVVVGPSLSISVKGKSEPLLVHQVIGHKDARGVLHTSLSKDQQDSIHQLTSIETPKDYHSSSNNYHAHEVEPVAQPTMAKSEESGIFAQAGATVTSPSEPLVLLSQTKATATAKYFMVIGQDNQSAEGPFTLNELKVKAEQPGFEFDKAFYFEEGDSNMIPFSENPVLSKRKAPPAPINAPLPGSELQEQALPEEWYISIGDDKTYGPYSVEQLKEALEKGHITRTTYAWKTGQENWIYVHEIPGFDRRGEKRTA